MPCYDIHAVRMASSSSSSSSHLSHTDPIHEAAAKIKNVEDEIESVKVDIKKVEVDIEKVEAKIESKDDSLNKSTDKTEKDFLRAEITQLRQEKSQLRQEKDRLHQKELLLLQQRPQQERPQQQQQEAGKTVSYDELYFISYGTRMTITIIGCHDHLTLLMSVFVCLSVSIVYHDDLHSALLCLCHTHLFIIPFQKSLSISIDPYIILFCL
jgi:hypothetical protein